MISDINLLIIGFTPVVLWFTYLIFKLIKKQKEDGK